jgi:acyl homoserine lactone synthase
MTAFTVARAGDPVLPPALFDSMLRLRAAVFSERLGWAVKVVAGREHDQFDLLGPYYAIAHDGHQATGCCRLLPSQGPNMLRDIFPALASASGIPHGSRIIEVSRFAVTRSLPTDTAADRQGFSEIPARLVAEVLCFSAQQGMDTVVGVTSAGFERLLCRLGMDIERLGPPQRIGPVMSLAFRLPLHRRNLGIARRLRATGAAGLARAA